MPTPADILQHVPSPVTVPCMCKCTDLARNARIMTEDEAYDQLRKAGTRLKLASKGMRRGESVERWQSIINRGLDLWIEARDSLPKERDQYD